MSNSPSKRPIEDLLEIMQALRTPVTGCPWDLEQTFDTITPYTIEEAYEVADAVARGDMDEFRSELGDLLLQVVFHAQMAKEEALFDFEDVVGAICEKMIRRHPHVFGDKENDGLRPDDVKQTWEEIKAQERDGKQKRESQLDDIPLALPALSRAVKLQKRAAQVGFDWPETTQVIDKLQEEMLELSQELAQKQMDQQKAFEEFGDLLFVYANLARHLKIDPEEALRATNDKFTRRFRRIEEVLAQTDRTPSDSSLEEMDALWDQAKMEEKSEST